MLKMDEIQKRLLEEIADLHDIPAGAYNLRANGESAGRRSTANIEILSKKDVSGLDINIKDGTVNQSVHIPVVLSASGLTETVYNDFHVGTGCDVLIVAGCGIDNCGSQDSEHDGVHRFYVGKNSKVKYVEKHYGSGDGTGKRILNPQTEVYMEEGIRVENRCLMTLDHYNVPQRFHAFFKATRQPLPTHDCFLDYMVGRPVQKFNIFFRHLQERKRLKKQLERETDLKIVLSSENNLEINSPTANKGDGLCHLCEALDIPSSQVMAVGDSDNDLDMLNYAGLAVAMGNGNRHVKAAADWVTSDNDDLGVARALAKYIL